MLFAARAAPATRTPAGDRDPFPSLLPRFVDRVSALLARIGPLAWLYSIVPILLFTDWLENGALPSTRRGWITELVGGVVIGLLVAKVRRDHRALQALARTDGLTGLLNRRAFEAAIEVECVRARRAATPLAVVYLDIDRFKQINDRFGHASGDQVLRQVALAIRQAIRAEVDGGFRLGGDEFAMLLPASSALQAEAVVERLRNFCALHDPRWAVGAIDFSAGLVELAPEESAGELIARSDAAMYRQKSLRRLRRSLDERT